LIENIIYVEITGNTPLVLAQRKRRNKDIHRQLRSAEGITWRQTPKLIETGKRCESCRCLAAPPLSTSFRTSSAINSICAIRENTCNSNFFHDGGAKQPLNESPCASAFHTAFPHSAGQLFSFWRIKSYLWIFDYSYNTGYQSPSLLFFCSSRKYYPLAFSSIVVVGKPL
jgi:hypothetical protein